MVMMMKTMLMNLLCVFNLFVRVIFRNTVYQSTGIE